MTARHPNTFSMPARASHRRRDRRARGVGLTAIAGAALVVMSLRALLPHVGAYTSLWTVALGLPAFLLASSGILLLINGAALPDNWRRDCAQAASARLWLCNSADPSIETASTSDGRLAVASLLAAHAIRASATSAKRASSQASHATLPIVRQSPLLDR